MSKAGIIALTRSLAHDYGKSGFRTNVVLPGAIKTTGTIAGEGCHFKRTA
jgi:NAD(P)-dependent dehydrogenase (short-subunit alcohol dehydrogenase family)